MKMFVKFITLGALLVASAPFALAGTITDFSGTGNFISGNGPFTATGNTWATGDTGFMFATLFSTTSVAPGLAASKQMQVAAQPFNFAHITPDTPPGAPLFSTGGGGLGYAFDVTSDVPLPLVGSSTLDLRGNFIVTSGSTVISSTPELFEVTISKTSAGGNAFDYTAILTQTPEPGSLALLGTGLLGIVGVARRRIFS